MLNTREKECWTWIDTTQIVNTWNLLKYHQVLSIEASFCCLPNWSPNIRLAFVPAKGLQWLHAAVISTSSGGSWSPGSEISPSPLTAPWQPPDSPLTAPWQPPDSPLTAPWQPPDSPLTAPWQPGLRGGSSTQPRPSWLDRGGRWWVSKMRCSWSTANHDHVEMPMLEQDGFATTQTHSSIGIAGREKMRESKWQMLQDPSGSITDLTAGKQERARLE